MKNSKKLLILVLSLVLLVAAFAVAVSAEGSETVTVAYPDGSEVQYPLGAKIVAPDGNTFAGKGNTLYLVSDAGWSFTLDGAPLANDTLVTEDMLGKTVTASAELTTVYYSVTFGTSVDYVTQDNLTTYLTVMKHGGCTITMYQDVAASGAITAKADRVTNATATSSSKTEVENAKHYLDLNGHTFSSSSTSQVFGLKTNYFFVYSSQPGGRIEAPKAALVMTDNDDYNVTVGGSSVNIKPSAKAVFGESTLDKAEYHQNLTVVCKTMVVGTLYGSSVSFLGGTYIQAEGTSNAWFLQMGRQNTGSSHVQNMRNVTMVLTSETTMPFHLGCSSERTFTNCTFISPVSGGVKLSTFDAITKTVDFVNCNFYNVKPMIENSLVSHKNSLFGGFTPDAPAGNVIVHAIPKTVTVEGKEYKVDTSFSVGTGTVMGINWGGKFTDYWAIGTTPYFNSKDYDDITFNADGTAIARLEASVDPSILVEVTSAMVGKTVNVEINYAIEDTLAFTWTDANGNVFYSVLGDKTEAEVGQAFYDAFNAPAGAYVIKLHADLLLPAAMGWGETLTNDNSALEHKSLEKGSITLDLNGFTLAVPALTEGINLSNSNALSSYPHTSEVIFGFERNNSATPNSFTITSSLPGARIVNDSMLAFLGVGEQDGTHIVINGENITYIGNGSVSHAIESQVAPTSLTVNGGTFVIKGNNPAFSFLSNITIKDAKISMLGDAPKSILAAHTWKRATSFAVENTVFYSKNAVPLFAFVGSAYSVAEAPADNSVVYSVSFTDCAFAGVPLVASIPNLDTLTYSGQTKADSAESLLAAYGAQPAGTVLAKFYTAMIAGDESVELYLTGYAAEADVLKVTYDGIIADEFFMIGSLFRPTDAFSVKGNRFLLDQGIVVVAEAYKDAMVFDIVGADYKGSAINAVNNINYVEKAIAFAVANGEDISAFALLSSETVGAELVAAIAAAPADATVLFYDDITAPAAIANAAAVTLELSGNTLYVSAAFAPAALITVKNGAVVLTADVAALFEGAAAVENAAIYNVAAPAALTTVGATVTDSKVYNLTLGALATLEGTVFHTDATASAFGAGIAENVLYNNNREILTVNGVDYKIDFTFAATADADKICTVNYLYKDAAVGTLKFYEGSIPTARIEAVEGYYYSYVATDALYEDASFVCTFVADEGKLKLQLVITDALNYVFYLQKQDGLSDLVFNGKALDFADVEVTLLDGVEYYAFTVKFEQLKDCLNAMSISYSVAFPSGITETVSAEASLLGYSKAILDGADNTDEEKALVYSLLVYLDTTMDYLGQTSETDLKAMVKAYAAYATDLSVGEGDEITSDYIRGALYIVDNKVSLALRVDADFKGEILVGTDLSFDAEGNPVSGKKFIYKDIVELDGNTYVILDDLAYSDLTDEYTVQVKLHGEVVESFTYTLADYTRAMAVQNMGYTPVYVKALYTFATLAAAYAA